MSLTLYILYGTSPSWFTTVASGKVVDAWVMVPMGAPSGSKKWNRVWLPAGVLAEMKFVIPGAANRMVCMSQRSKMSRVVPIGRLNAPVPPCNAVGPVKPSRLSTMRQRPMDAEKALLVARRYGNYPTMDYEIASARLRAGFYREAAEALSQSYSIQNGEISTKHGGRVPKGSADISELVGLERKASIAEPQSAESAETSAQLQALLDLWTKLNSEKPDQAALGKAVDAFVRGGDVMRTHRLIFAAKERLDRKKDLSKVLELTKEATGSAETAVDIPNPSSAVMADELYESRRLAALKDQYIAVPDVSRSTLVSIIRRRIEEISGWTLFQLDNSAESIVRLKRAVSVLPTDSAWWRTSVWRLGTVLESRGQDQDALDSYTRSYQSGQPDAFKYSVIAAVYKRVNGSTFGLYKLIGPNPSAPNAEVTAQNIEPPAIPSVLNGSTQARPSDVVPVPIASPSTVPLSNNGTTSTEA